MSNHINVKHLEEILELLNSIQYVEYLSGIRDQAAHIMRTTIQWIEEDGV